MGVPRAEEEGDPSLRRQVHPVWEEDPQGQMLCDLPTLRGAVGVRAGRWEPAGGRGALKKTLKGQVAEASGVWRMLRMGRGQPA